MAEMIMKDLARKAGLEGRFLIESAATSAEELGNPVDFRAKRTLAKHGVRCENRAARQLSRRDYGAYDLLIGMEQINVRNMLRILGGDPENKVRLLMRFAGSEDDIDDPWYTGRFDEVFIQIEAACQALLTAVTDDSLDS